MYKFGFMSLYKDYVEKIQDRKLVLFGAGDNAIHLITRYYRHDKIYAIWDNNPSKWGKQIMGIPVSEPRFSLPEADEEVVVIITVSDELAINSIQEQLKQMGIKYVYPKAILSLSNEIERYNGDFSRKFHELNSFGLIERNKDKIQQVRRLLADEKSQVVYDAIVEKTKYNIGDYTDICDDIYEHYFSDDIFHYQGDEVLVDGGAYLGEDTIRFARIIGTDNLKRSYCFEPDAANYLKCIQNLLKFFGDTNGEQVEGCYKSSKFIIHEAGLHSANENVGFISYGTHNSVFTHLRKIEGDTTVSAVKLDDVIEDCDKVTLIKLDVEGAEIASLQGAERIIKEHKPKLAICIYHMVEDLWEIPLFIHQLVPEYKLFMRHHTTKFWDSVVYATI